jgi:hypothetical protein
VGLCPDKTAGAAAQLGADPHGIFDMSQSRYPARYARSTIRKRRVAKPTRPRAISSLTPAARDLRGSLVGYTGRPFRRPPRQRIPIITPLFRRATMNGRRASSAPQTRPQVRLIASARRLRRFLLGMNGSFKSSSHREMFYPLDVPFEDCLSFGIVERRDRRADFIARAPKEGRRRPPPLPPERVNSIRHHQHRERVVRIPRDRETQKKEQPFANLLGSPILGISCASLGTRSCGSKGLGPLRCAVCARRRTACLLEHGESRSHGTRPFSSRFDRTLRDGGRRPTTNS